MDDDKTTIDGILSKNSEMIDSFIIEAKEHLDTIEGDLLNLEKQKDNPDPELVNKVFRAIHSVKGAAGFSGLANMTKLAHVMETLLTKMRGGVIRPESEYIDALLAGVDLLAAMLDDIEHSNEVDIAGVHSRLSNLLEQALSPGGAGEAASALGHSGETASPEDSPPAQEEPPEFADESSTEASILKKSGIDFGNTIRIPVDIADQLMVLAGELVLVRNQHLLYVDDSDPDSRNISQRLDLVTSELQETVIRTRMQPINKLFQKFPRIVRDLGKNLDKEIQLAFSGSEAELDKTILEALADPMTHIIRNSCSHGIETPEERLRAGKPRCGRITLAAYYEAARVKIEVRDDGRGIDPQRIRKRALERRVKTESELERMSDKEILRLVLMPGFTTVDEVSDVFGRGVGMDVVKSGIEELGGSVDLESIVGEGTTIHLRLPLTLAILPCLIVTVGEHRYAIPQGSLVELICLYDEDVRTKMECADDQEFYRLRERLLPMVRLSEVLARPVQFTREVRAEISKKYRMEEEKVWQEYISAGGRESGARLTRSINFAVLKAGMDRFGLIFDTILGTEEIVVKPMHSAMKSLSIYSGATVMGDGKGALILDVEGIARHAGLMREGRIDKGEEQVDKPSKGEDLQTVLLFKYGEKEQFAISLPLIRRIEPVALSDIECIGDKEYVTVEGIPTLILRLDHILNVSPIVERDKMFLLLPRHIKRPVGLLISSLIDLEETSMEVDLETYVEDGVLGTGIVRDSMTLFLDICRLAEIIEHKWFADRWKNPAVGAGASNEPAKQILLLEDVPLFKHLVKRYLEADGYNVITAENGRAGLDLMNEFQFDLIVSDLDMPVMDGWQFLTRVRQGSNQTDVPAIALTALNSDMDRQRAMECGFDRYEVKIEREHFLASVAELLELGKDQPRISSS